MAQKDDLLMAHLLGALDPGDALSVDEGLGDNASGRFRLSGLGFLAGARPTMRGQTGVGLEVDAAPVLSDDGPLRAGDRASLKLQPPVPAGEIHPVLFRETSGGRDLIYPVPGGRWTAMDRFRRDGETFLLDLVVADPAGEHVYTLILLPADLFPTPWPHDDPRWIELWESWQRGDLPGARVSLTVSA